VDFKGLSSQAAAVAPGLSPWPRSIAVPQQIHLGQPSSSPPDNAIIEIYWRFATAL